MATTEISDIAVLQAQMAEVIKRLDNMNDKLDKDRSSYLPREEFNEWKKGQAYQKVLLAIIVAGVTGLVEYVLIHRKA